MSAPHWFGRAIMSTITLIGGVSLAVVPATTVSISSRLFNTEEQGFIAVAVMVASLVGQLTFAIVVESRLSSPSTDRRVVFPLWLSVLSITTAIILMFSAQSALALVIALPVLIAALEVGRGVSVAEHLDRREVVASVAVGAGAITGVIVGFFGQSWALLPLILGIIVATGVRCLPVSHKASHPDHFVMGWVVADTAITGAVYPLLNAMILGLIGPAQSVLFTAIMSVSGLLAIPLNFLRLRLLKEHSMTDIVVSAGAVVMAGLTLLALEMNGILGYIFGEAWRTDHTLSALLLACGWRSASLATTIPFAALRRRGEVRLLTGLRTVVAVLTFALAAVGLVLGSLSAVFTGLLIAELGSAALYEFKRRRIIACDVKECA